MIHAQKNNLGFTLIESVVAISVLVMALVGPMTLASRSIYVQRTAKNTLIAASLAQEGLELMRWYRDNNVLQALAQNTFPPENNWLQGFLNCKSLSGCGIDEHMLRRDIDTVTPGFQVPALPDCSTSANCALLFNDSKKQYELCGASCTPTPFTRKIQITKELKNNAAGLLTFDEIEVTVTVEWSDGTQSNPVIVKERLYAW